MTQHLGIMLVSPTVYVWLLFNGDIDSVRKHLHDGIINMSPAHFAKECMGKFKDQVLITPYSHRGENLALNLSASGSHLGLLGLIPGK